VTISGRQLSGAVERRGDAINPAKMQEFVGRAASCEVMAVTATDPAAKAQFAELAAQWRGLAARIERLNRERDAPPI
jgi:hypothetical protein